MTHLPRIAVIIPFFQREKGILAKALRSVIAQGYPATKLYVQVIDDGSPLSAETEIAESGIEDTLRVKVLRKLNSGPNEARNAGLDVLEDDTEVIAYLDSDDEWIGQHLSRAVHVLSLGFTAYFANLFHLGDSVPEFEKARRVNVSEHPSLGDETLRAYSGDMTRQVVTANIIFMPSLVIDAASLGHVRFPQAHRHGGGDYLYWLALIAANARFAFSTLPEVRCGKGINMWYGSGWGTDGYAGRILDEARFRQRALDEYVKDEATRVALRRRLAELQVGFIRDAAHRARRGKPVDWASMRALYTETRVRPFSLLPLAGEAVAGFLKSKAKG